MAKAKKVVVTPSIEFEDVKKINPLKEAFAGPMDSWPKLTAVGYTTVKGTNKYISYVLTLEKGEVKIDASEPDFRAVAEDEAKINFVNCFMQGDHE